MKKLLLISGCALLLAACSQTHTMICEDERLGLQFSGFVQEELDTVLVRHFTAGSNFSQPGTTDTLTALFSHPQPQPGPILRPDSDRNRVLAPGTDYEIIVLATGSTTRITDIRQEGQKLQTYKVPWGSKVDIQPCVNAVTAYQQDSLQVKIAEPEREPLYITVKR